EKQTGHESRTSSGLIPREVWWWWWRPGIPVVQGRADGQQGGGGAGPQGRLLVTSPGLYVREYNVTLVKTRYESTWILTP
uniref:Uncharacterized protein n=1 Tax=Oryza brachyantha TaxID=4533 RepID=J3M8D6_ORYBR